MDTSQWNWEPGERLVANPGESREKFEWLEEPYVSADGETFAAVANVDGEFTACVNDETWENTFERVWNLGFGPDGRLTGCASDMGEWKFVVDGEPWEESFGYVWDPQFSADGKNIAIAVQNDGSYGMALDGVVWENLYANANGFAIAPGGDHAGCCVQAIDMGQADIDQYKEGAYTVAVDGTPWETMFTNVFGVVFSPDGKRVAAEVRTNLYDHTVAVDGTPWSSRYQGVWTPIFDPKDGSVVAPVRQAGKWSLARDGHIIWSPYVQCWHAAFSKGGERLAAIVSPAFGRWTVAVDDKAWGLTFGEMCTDLVLSADGARAAALGKDGGKWAVMVDGKAWTGRYDMAWAPVFSADGAHVAAMVEKGGKYTVAVDGKEYARAGEAAFDPAFSPDGRYVLIKMVEDGLYHRRVVPVSDFK